MPKLEYSRKAVPLPAVIEYPAPAILEPWDNPRPDKFHVTISGPVEKLELCRSWLEFCLDNYPIVYHWGVDIRFTRKDYFIRCSVKEGMQTFGGNFCTRWIGTGDIAICIGKTEVIPEDEIMRVFFHEYSHFLQLDQNRYDGESASKEKDADDFALAAVEAFMFAQARKTVEKLQKK